MSNRFSRFQHLERPRDEKDAREHPVELRDGGRFESVEGPGRVALEPTVPEAHLERFKRQGETPVRLDPASEQQRFPRCIRCQTSNGRFTAVCTTCGADLQTAEQRADDEARGRAEAEERARVSKAMEVPREAAPGERHEEPAPPGRSFEPSLGVALSRRLSTRGRWMAGVGAVAVPWWLTRASSEGVRWVGVYLAVFLCASFVPNGFWTMGARRE